MMRSHDSLDGVLLVDKQPGMTSHDVVAMARRCLNIKKIGHCGTLDPMATGLLILVIGRGTKLQDLLMAEDKEYEGTMTLGVETGTQDKEGAITAQSEVPPLTMEEIEATFSSFDGDFYQTPPMVSAIKKDGVPLYKLARKGQEIEREPRLVHIFGHKITRFESPEIDFRVTCSKGFYVRTYAFDIGRKLGCGAHLSALRRTRSGNLHFELGKSVPVSVLKEGNREVALANLLSLPEVSRIRGV